MFFVFFCFFLFFLFFVFFVFFVGAQAGLVVSYPALILLWGGVQAIPDQTATSLIRRTNPGNQSVAQTCVRDQGAHCRWTLTPRTTGVGRGASVHRQRALLSRTHVDALCNYMDACTASQACVGVPLQATGRPHRSKARCKYPWVAWHPVHCKGKRAVRQIKSECS